MTLTTRQLMVKGSEWIAKEDFSIIDLNKSVYGNDAEISDKMGWQAAGATKNRQLISEVRMYFKKGTTFKVLDKASTYFFSKSSNDYFTGVFIPMSVDGIEMSLQLADISPYLEITKQIKQYVYVLYSPSKGQYVEKRDHVYDTAFNYTPTLQWNEKLTKAMKKKRPQDAKMLLLELSGYFDGIDTSNIYYVFEPGSIATEIPEDLVVQEIDKATKEVVSSYLAKDYIEYSHRLKPLTQLYGSPVRSIFKDIEGNDDFACVLVYKGMEAHLKELKNRFKKIGLDRGTYKMKSDTQTVAIALQDESDGLMIMLQLSNDVSFKPILLNTKTLKEIVNV